MVALRAGRWTPRDNWTPPLGDAALGGGSLACDLQEPVRAGVASRPLPITATALYIRCAASKITEGPYWPRAHHRRSPRGDFNLLLSINGLKYFLEKENAELPARVTQHLLLLGGKGTRALDPRVRAVTTAARGTRSN